MSDKSVFSMWWIAQEPKYDDEGYIEKKLIAGPFLSYPSPDELEVAKVKAKFPDHLKVVRTDFMAVED